MKKINKIAEEKAYIYQREIGMNDSVSDEHIVSRRMGFYDGFLAGAQWQKEQDLAEMAQSKSPLSVAYANRCFENGKQAMKEQMMKGAVAVEVVGEKRDLRLIDSTQRCFFNAKRGNWLNIIIVKED